MSINSDSLNNFNLTPKTSSSPTDTIKTSKREVKAVNRYTPGSSDTQPVLPIKKHRVKKVVPKEERVISVKEAGQMTPVKNYPVVLSPNSKKLKIEWTPNAK